MHRSDAIPNDSFVFNIFGKFAKRRENQDEEDDGWLLPPLHPRVIGIKTMNPGMSLHRRTLQSPTP
jgi:hypothetical protein